MAKKDFIIFDNPEELACDFANKLINWIKIHSGNQFHIAISGGKTPDILFSVLAQKHSNSPLWKKVHFWWVDERMVPPTHSNSNFGVASKLLFSQISIPDENIHRIKGENDPDLEAISYSDQIRKSLGLKDGWPVFDLIILGMGDDGHTASIFPDKMELLTSKNICEVATHPDSCQKRVTLTGKAINNAAKVCFLVTGESKSRRLNELLNEPQLGAQLPAFHIRIADWYVDKQAFSLIS